MQWLPTWVKIKEKPDKTTHWPISIKVQTEFVFEICIQKWAKSDKTFIHFE